MDESTRVVEIKADTAGRVYSQPDPTAKETERDPTWYADNIKYGCTYYNQNYSTVLTSGGKVSQSPANPAGNNNFLQGETPVNRMIRMMSYLNGWQPNLNYAHLTPNVTSTNLMPTWIRGQKIYSVVNVMRDVLSQMIDNIGFDVNDMSESAQNAKKEMLDNLMISHEMKKAMADITKSTGVNVDFTGGKQFEFSEDAKKFMQEEYKDMDSLILTKIAEHLWGYLGMKDGFLQHFSRSVCTAARLGVEHTVVNGRQKMNIYSPYELIVDPRVDDEYNKFAQFAGYVKYYSPNELFTIAPQLLKKKAEILEMTREQNLGAPFNTMTNLNWWIYGNGQQRGMIAAVKLYWKTLVDEGRKQVEGKYGRKRHIKVKNGEGDPNRKVEDVCCGLLVGNRYLTAFGLGTNVQEDFYDRSRVKLPLMVFMPGMNLGDSVSVVSRISDLSDERDAIRLKIREGIGKSKGRGYFVKAWKFGNAANQREMVQDLSTTGIHVLTHSGEAPDEGRDDEGNVIEAVDMTLDPNVLKLYDVVRAIDADMMEIAKVSASAMGNDEVQKYMGVGVVQNALQQGSGNASMYSSYINFIQMNLQYAVDVAKYLMTEDDSDYPAKIIGDRGVEYLKISKRIRYSDPLTTLVISPFITQADRQQLMGIADRISSQGGMDMLDVITVMISKTIPKMKDELEYALKKRKSADEHENAILQALQSSKDQNAQLVQMITNMSQQHGADRIQQAKDLNLIAKELAKINLKGAWDLKVKEVEAGHDTEGKLADHFINTSTMLIEHELQKDVPAPPPAGK